MFIIVVIKLIAPRMLLTPARCRLKMVRSTEGLACARLEDNGGYTVHPVPAPPPATPPKHSRVKDGGRSQNLMLFIRGKAISGLPIIRGTNQLPKPPIKIGITIKKIMTKACAVTIVLYTCSLPRKDPGVVNSRRIMALRDLPNIAAHLPSKKYRVPMSLWFVE